MQVVLCNSHKMVVAVAVAVYLTYVLKAVEGIDNMTT